MGLAPGGGCWWSRPWRCRVGRASRWWTPPGSVPCYDTPPSGPLSTDRTTETIWLFYSFKLQPYSHYGKLTFLRMQRRWCAQKSFESRLKYSEIVNEFFNHQYGLYLIFLQPMCLNKFPLFVYYSYLDFFLFSKMMKNILSHLSKKAR